MSFLLTSRSRDAAIRTSGLAMLPFGALAVAGLYQRVHVTPPHGATAFEFCLAAASFLLLSTGSALFVLGRHIFDQVQVSSRWAPQAPFQRRKLWIGPDALIDLSGRSNAKPHPELAAAAEIDAR